MSRYSIRLANLGAVLGVLVIWWMFGRMVHMRKVGLHGGLASWALLFALQALLLFFAILVHEGGHLLAGRCVGFHVQAITLGPLQVRHAGRGLALTVNRLLPWLGGGATMSVPGRRADAADLRWRAAIVAAGGPLASLVLAVGAAVPLMGYHHAYHHYVHHHGSILAVIDFWLIFSLSLIVIWSLAACVGNVIPVSVGGRLSDGAVLLALLRGGSWAERLCTRILTVEPGHVQGAPEPLAATRSETIPSEGRSRKSRCLGTSGARRPGGRWQS